MIKSQPSADLQGRPYMFHLQTMISLLTDAEYMCSEALLQGRTALERVLKAWASGWESSGHNLADKGEGCSIKTHTHSHSRHRARDSAFPVYALIVALSAAINTCQRASVLWETPGIFGAEFL